MKAVISFLWSMLAVSVGFLALGIVGVVRGELFLAFMDILLSALFARMYFRERKGLGS
ncbi:MAG TPA: hypothetical protein VEB65_08515 [Solirubrobacterales bacterium]|nr:hypothetical protein [Solirubrobacterales bacterium]